MPEDRPRTRKPTGTPAPKKTSSLRSAQPKQPTQKVKVAQAGQRAPTQRKTQAARPATGSTSGKTQSNTADTRKPTRAQRPTQGKPTQAAGANGVRKTTRKKTTSQAPQDRRTTGGQKAIQTESGAPQRAAPRPTSKLPQGSAQKAPRTPTGKVPPQPQVTRGATQRVKQEGTSISSRNTRVIQKKPAAGQKPGTARESTSRRPTSRHSTSKLGEAPRAGTRRPTSKRPTATLRDQESHDTDSVDERTAALAQSQRKNKVIWGVSILATLLLVGGAVYMLLNAPDNNGGGNEANPVVAAFIQDVARGNLDTARIKESQELTNAIAGLDEELRTTLDAGLPIPPKAAVKPSSVERYAENRLSSKILKDHGRLQEINKTLRDATRLLNTESKENHDQAVATILALRVEIIWLSRNIERFEAIDDPAIGDLHDKILAKIQVQLDKWQQDITKLSHPKFNPAFGEAKLRIKKSPDDEVRESSNRHELFYSLLNNADASETDQDSIERWREEAESYNDQGMLDDYQTLKKHFPAWAESAFVAFTNADVSFQELLLTDARESRNRDLDAWEKWLGDQKIYLDQCTQYTEALRAVAESAELMNELRVKKMIDGNEANLKEQRLAYKSASEWSTAE